MNIVSQILIRLSSNLIGEDQYGNKYYCQKKSDKRFVVFNGKVEASKIPPMWHAWLHKITNKPPLKRKKEKTNRKAKEASLIHSVEYL